GDVVDLLDVADDRQDEPDAPLAGLAVPGDLVPERGATAARLHLGDDTRAAVSLGQALPHRLHAAVDQHAALGHVATVEARLEPVEAGARCAVPALAHLEEGAIRGVEEADHLESVLHRPHGGRDGQQPHQSRRAHESESPTESHGPPPSSVNSFTYTPF